MPKRKQNQSNLGSNVPFWQWANGPVGEPLEEWQPTPEQLGWPNSNSGAAEQPNYDYDEQEDGEVIWFQEGQTRVTNHVSRGKTEEKTPIPRSNLTYELSATSHILHQNENAVVDHYENNIVYDDEQLGAARTLVAMSKGFRSIPTADPDPPARTLVAMSKGFRSIPTADPDPPARTLVAMSKGFRSIPTADPDPPARTLVAMSKVFRSDLPTGDPDPPAPKAPSKPLTEEELEELMRLPNSSAMPLESEGYILGVHSFDIHAGHCSNWRELVKEKTKGLNPGNSEPNLWPDILDAMQRKEHKLFEEEKIDEAGRPLTKGGKLIAADATRGKVLQTWFDEAMKTVSGYDRLAAGTKRKFNDTVQTNAPKKGLKLTVKPRSLLVRLSISRARLQEYASKEQSVGTID